jgi:uncharacterized protein YecT (DUF1311 family)
VIVSGATGFAAIDPKSHSQGKAVMHFRVLPKCAGIVLLGFLIAKAAQGQEGNLTARCVSIPNVDERIECLESRGASLDRAPPDVKQSTRIGPSFDCRAATSSMERAICGDPALSELDLRMGQQYQQALRQKKATDAQALVDSQRSWILQRNSTCGAVPGSAVWSCIVDMTKKRIATLSETPLVTVEETPARQPNPVSQSNPSQPNAGAAPRTQPTFAPSNAPQSNAPSSSVTSEGPNQLLVALFVMCAAIGAIAVFNNIRRRERLVAEQRRLAAERQRLVDKYGDCVADRILAHQIWQGMTEEHLIESWGSPADRDYEIKHSKTKETWKYGQIGRNRFRNRVFLENGIVVGWKQ